MNILDEMPKGKSDYDKWIQDGKIIVKGNIDRLWINLYICAKNSYGLEYNL